MTTTDPFTVLDGGPTIEERQDRLAEGADQIADERSRGSILSHPSFLLGLSAALMTLGLSVILIGWSGAANSTLSEEQLPYLISGGIFGLALAVIGALTFFSHWLTVSIREARAREVRAQKSHDEMMGALRGIARSLATQEEIRNGRARSTTAEGLVRRAPRSR